MLGDLCQHLWPDFFTIVKCKNVVRPPGSSKNAMRSTVLPFDSPTSAKQGGEYMLSLC